MKIWYYLFVLLFAVACNSEESQIKHDQLASVTILDCSQNKDTTYFNTISTELYNIKIYAVKHPEQQELVVHTDDGVMMLAEIRRQLPGEIIKVNTGDLNQNNAPELYIWCKTSADSSTLLAFEMRGSEYLELKVPTPKDPMLTNYEMNASAIIAQTKNSNTQYRLKSDGVFEKV